LKYRFNGKEGKLSFGPYPDVSLKDARDLREHARAQLAKGLYLSLAKREAKAEELGQNEHAFNKVADQFVNIVTKDGGSLSTLKKLEWLLEEARADFGRMPVAEITAPMILKH